MAFCGYNETMASGIRLLVEGMIEAMLARHNSGASMEEVLRTELIDLAKMNETLTMADRQPGDLLNALTAINLFAQTIFSRSTGKKSDADYFAEECRHSGIAFINLVKLTEERHLSELHRRKVSHGSAIAMESVAKWLLQHASEVVESKADEVATV
jgi:hypothetical protein